VDQAQPLYDHPIVAEGWGVSGSGPGGELTFVGREFCSAGDCVEAARLPDGSVALRSSAVPDAPLLVVTAGEWRQFLDSVKSARFDGL
jgi:hypothetical protein